jgi:hypothetical protein
MKIHRVVQMLGATTSTGKLSDDMYDLNYKDYYSKAEDRYIPISHMDFQHMVRAFVKQNEEDVRTDTQEGKIKDCQVEYNKTLNSLCASLSKERDIWKEKAMNMVEKSSYQVMWDNCQELQKKLDQEVRIDTQEGKVVELEDTLKNTIKANNELIQLNKQLKESLRQVNLTPTVSTQAYDIAWKNIDELNDQVKSLLERNAVLSNLYNSSLSKDSETSDTWKERYEHEAKMAESWKSNYYKKDVIKGCGYTFSEIPNDTDGQEFVDTMKKYFNKKSYKMRVKGQHIKPELRGTGATYWGQNKDESSHMKVYIDIK